MNSKITSLGVKAMDALFGESQHEVLRGYMLCVPLSVIMVLSHPDQIPREIPKELPKDASKTLAVQNPAPQNHN